MTTKTRECFICKIIRRITRLYLIMFAVFWLLTLIVIVMVFFFEPEVVPGTNAFLWVNLGGLLAFLLDDICTERVKEIKRPEPKWEDIYCEHLRRKAAGMDFDVSEFLASKRDESQ